MIGLSFSSLAVSPSERSGRRAVVARTMISSWSSGPLLTTVRVRSPLATCFGAEMWKSRSVIAQCGCLLPAPRGRAPRTLRPRMSCSEDQQASSPERRPTAFGPGSASEAETFRSRPRAVDAGRSRRISRNRLWDSTRRGSLRGGLGWEPWPPDRRNGNERTDARCDAASRPAARPCAHRARARAPARLCRSAAAVQRGLPGRREHPGLARAHAGRQARAGVARSSSRTIRCPRSTGASVTTRARASATARASTAARSRSTRSSGSWATSRWSRAGSSTRRQRVSGKRVLVIGAGPSGLSAAYHLARLGHEVEIRDSGAEPGGMMRYGIPAYRLPRDVLDGELRADRGASASG